MLGPGAGRAAIVLALIACAPAPSVAQPDRFAQAVSVLADLMVAGSPRAGDLDEVANRMAAALAVWDRTLGDLEGRVARDLASATDDRAFQLRVELGLAYHQRGRFADAVRQFDEGATARPSASDVHVLRAFSLEAAGRSDAAADAFRSAWDADTTSSPVKAYYVLRRRGAVADARAAKALDATYRRLITEPPTAVRAPFSTSSVVQDDRAGAAVIGDTRLIEPVALLVSGRFSEAVAALRPRGTAVAGVAGESPRARFERARLHEADGRVSDARRDYEAAMSGTLAGRSALLVSIGRLAQIDGDPAGAIEAFTHAVRLGPNDPFKHRELASAFAAVGQREEAFVELVAALLINPADPLTMADIGQIHLDAGRDADAVAAFRRALELRPDRFETRYGLATALTREGRVAEAARELELYDRARRDMVERQRREPPPDVERRGATPQSPPASGAR